MEELIYESYSSHDCETWYSCPYCKKKIGSWSLPSSGAVKKGEKIYCPHCKKECKKPIIY